ncbi:hypothetical protein LMBV_046 [Largemouth bass virus]|uniref:RING-type domain-containing protein n=1 Tax=Largemouth bass virus TaxID=176656 RepID=A0A9X7TQX9_9VIRU|nr:hypothetical protein LMBV_046 [Largemouth bass virus]QJE49195.1 hypothetical protein LMBV_046 [Largemouth bass virus]
MECLYCFDVVDQFPPCTAACGAVICGECAEGVMRNSEGLPKCHCGTLYVPKTLQLYLTKSGMTLLRSRVTESWETHLRKSQQYDAIFNDGVATHLAALPPAAKTAALKWLKRDVHNYVKSKVDTTVERVEDCPSEFCMGFVVGKKPCDTCGTKECPTCKVLIKTQTGHVCKKEDLETVQAVEQYIKCPTCKKHVEKIDGCNDMTCAYCKTDFNYRTGEVQAGGTHNKIFITDHRNLLSVKFASKLGQDTISMLQKLESMITVPKFPTKIPARNRSAFIVDWISDYTKASVMRTEYGKLCQDLSTKTAEDAELHTVVLATKFNLI